MGSTLSGTEGMWAVDAMMDGHPGELLHARVGLTRTIGQWLPCACTRACMHARLHSLWPGHANLRAWQPCAKAYRVPGPKGACCVGCSRVPRRSWWQLSGPQLACTAGVFACRCSWRSGTRSLIGAWRPFTLSKSSVVMASVHALGCLSRACMSTRSCQEAGRLQRGFN